MSHFDDNEIGIGPDAEPAEREELISLAERLERGRPIPAPGFRGELRRGLLAAFGSGRSRPQRARAFVAAYAGSGFALLAVATLGVGGVGPLSAG